MRPSRSTAPMMSASSIGAAKASGYARYLESKTIAPERGDYYLTPDGELTQAPGRWLADAETLERLGIDPSGGLAGDDFISLMEGRHPRTRRFLRREGANGQRAAGIDVTLSAPKSVSTVWALSRAEQREALEAAHSRAVAQTLEHLREQVPVVRRRDEGQLVEEVAKDLVAAEYRHTTARGVSGAKAPDPQLHSHVVITNAIREDDRIVAVGSRPIFRAGRELGAYYRSALAQELKALGYAIEANTGKHGLYFEIAGVPRELCEAFSGRSREVAAAAERFRARHGRAPERGELRNLALENRRAKQLTTRGDLQRVWNETAAHQNFGPEQAAELLGRSVSSRSRTETSTLPDRVERQLAEHHSVFQRRELHATVLEQSVGQLSPKEALRVAKMMIEQRQVIPLEGGRFTTLAVRGQEQAIERRVTELAQPVGRDVGQRAREHASREVAERIGNPLSAEQLRALEVMTGPERAAVLIGPAGTGKGVVIDAAARAEQLAGREMVGIAVSGSTAERLGADSPALANKTLTLDALIARADVGTVRVGPSTTVFLDEAGMVDHKRLEAVTELIERSGAKLIAVGDGRQLPAIGAGGMFDRLSEHAPTAELADIHRTKDPLERRAWSALRAGEPERAMAHYLAKGRLHMADTREQAGERAVRSWAMLTKEMDLRQVALIADASNLEIDRLNARAQHFRAERGELGLREVQVPGVHYGLREGDLVAFAAQYRPRGEARVENGSRGQVLIIDERSVLLQLDGSNRLVELQRDELDRLRLAYASHVYRQQGATVERSLIVTGGWQTSQESAYVQASRAREGSDWFIAREELGEEGQDAQRVERLAQRMRRSSRQHASLAYPERGREPFAEMLDRGPLSPTRAPLHRFLPSLLDRARSGVERDRAPIGPDRGR